VSITPVTDQWATIALSGASARSVLESLRPGVDLSSEAMPHLAVREGRLLGGLARIYRVSFSGELTYEISVPADKGPALWNALLERGEARGIAPYGVEALMSLRLEKGFLHLGTDTDGTTVPDDVGWGAIAARKRADYIGKRSLGLPENRRPDRLQLVGLTCGRTTQMLVGSHLRLDGSNEVTDGWITSSGRTALSDEPIALAMLRGGRGRMREEVDVHVDGRVVMQATVVEPPFFDRQGERMNA
jgi:sarcosine oxidase subunit alpha